MGESAAGIATNDPPLILVADDVAANVELLSDQLHMLGYRTVAATDGPAALEACLTHRPDLAILDVSMPAGDLGVDERSTGFEVCRRLKRDPRTARIPIIFVTALNDSTERVKGIEVGGDDFLTKPHNRLVLGARVRSLIRLKTATDALEESVRKLREVEKTRDDLMKMLVHDLKTPLTSVLATLEMTMDGDFGPITDTQREVLTDAEEKAEDLLSLIEGLLEVARLEDASLALELTSLAPGAFLAEMAHEWEHRLAQNGSAATINVAEDAPVFEADKAILKRVFSNLLQNALTHTGRSVAIRISARRNPNGVLFVVEDNGPGIPREFHEAIFRKFEQVKEPSKRPARSSGLGLAFCRLACEAHGGRIWVESADGKGSAFHIVLPLHPRQASGGAPAP